MKHIVSLKDLLHEHETQGTNGDYPEISFTFISQTVEGLMGISADAASGKISICPHLPEEIDDIKLTGLKFGDYSVDVSLERNKITLKNNSSKLIFWKILRVQKLLLNHMKSKPFLKKEKSSDRKFICRELSEHGKGYRDEQHKSF